MEFILIYDGILKSGKSSEPEDKQKIRRQLSVQLERFLESNKSFRDSLFEKHEPISFGSAEIIDGDLQWIDGEKHSLIEDEITATHIRGFNFIPLISSKLSMYAELDIVLLTTDPQSDLITSNGDIDNKLKTLFDALGVPAHANQISVEGVGETIYCLLEDDKLIRKVTVEKAQLLNEPKGRNEVLALIKVKTKVGIVGLRNIQFV